LTVKIEVNDALEELRRNSGTQFDLMVVELLCEVVSEELSVAVKGDGGVESAGAPRTPARALSGAARTHARPIPR
jgi:hypothetical protein